MLLSRLAPRLEVPPAIVPWPALVIEETAGEQVLGCWQDLASEVGGVVPDLAILTAEVGDCGIVAGASAALLADGGRRLSAGTPLTNPVHELPAGRLVGWWGLDPTRRGQSGWLATPVEIRAARCRWKVEGEGVDGTIEDVVGADRVNGASEAVALRVPGWLVDNLRPGTPAGLIVTELAIAAQQRGLPLWVPNVGAEALQMVLRLPGVLWVDGSAVPRPG